MPRNRVLHTLSFDERCKAIAQGKLAIAVKLPPGAERDTLESEAKDLKNASQLEAWLNSPGLRPPT